ncbi:hypothetical protein P12x_005681 [Tundrisphaera lichenicola]|uniref:hypothetical protein n=1 Tax=Tundrisphaera lichenicola TaxID=2029860 RepID=UPI003EBC3D0F
MRPLLGLALACSILASTSSPTRAEHAKINLDVNASGEQVTAFVDQTPPEYGKNPRPVIKARAGEPIKIQFLLTNVYPNKTLENVVVHFYVARQEKAGQKPTPDLGDEGVVVLESAFDMDFKPGGKAGARHSLKIDQPGAYLVRVESIQTGSDHEHFAAVDLVVEAARP